MGNCHKFEETELPPEDAFYRKLNMKGVRIKIINVPMKFGMEWYLAKNILILEDIFKKFLDV